MTRINCVPVETLHNKHLLAEYRELPRVFSLARLDKPIPPKYCMGKGHVTFFYNKLKYLYKRQCLLVDEMNKRGYKTSYQPRQLYINYQHKEGCWNDWTPTKEDIEISQNRINERVKGWLK